MLQQILRTQDLRKLMRQNSSPIYFIDWCLFIALGMEEHIGNIEFICATDTFNGQHPRVFTPKSFHYNHALTSEQTLNALLRNAEVIEHIRSRGPGKLLVWLFDEETEQLAAELGLECCLPPHHLRKYWDNKPNTNRLAKMAGVPCVPYILSPIADYAELRRMTSYLGEDLVVQMPHGMSGATTFFISNEADFDKHKSDIATGEEMKIMRRIRCHGASLEACITRHGVAVSPLVTELIGIPEIAVYQGGWCGNEFFPNAFPTHHAQTAQKYAIQLGEQLRKLGYNGYFEPDFLIDEDTDILYLGEINMRFSGFTPLINNANIARQDIPLLLLHLAEWMDIDYELDIDTLNARWMQPENILPLSLLHVKNVRESLAKPIPSGIYRLAEDGIVHYLRPAVSPQEIAAPDEAFWFSTTGTDSIIERGDEIGGLFLHTRVTVDGKRLTAKTKLWLDGLLNL